MAFLVGTAPAALVRSVLREGHAAIATINLAEAFDVAERSQGVPQQAAWDVMEPLIGSSLRVFPLDVDTARRAAALRSKHYHRVSRRISMADAVLLATAAGRGRVMTPDPDVAAVAGAEGIEVVPMEPE